MPTIFLHPGKFHLAEVGKFHLAQTGEFSTGADTERHHEPIGGADTAARGRARRLAHRGVGHAHPERHRARRAAEPCRGRRELQELDRHESSAGVEARVGVARTRLWRAANRRRRCARRRRALIALLSGATSESVAPTPRARGWASRPIKRASPRWPCAPRTSSRAAGGSDVPRQASCRSLIRALAVTLHGATS